MAISAARQDVLSSFKRQKLQIKQDGFAPVFALKGHLRNTYDLDPGFANTGYEPAVSFAVKTTGITTSGYSRSPSVKPTIMNAFATANLVSSVAEDYDGHGYSVSFDLNPLDARLLAVELMSVFALHPDLRSHHRFVATKKAESVRVAGATGATGYWNVTCVPQHTTRLAGWLSGDNVISGKLAYLEPFYRPLSAGEDLILFTFDRASAKALLLTLLEVL